MKLLRGDCRERLRDLDADSIHAVVTDPPYGLSKEPDIAEVLRHWLAGDDYQHGSGGFMGKSWDSFVPGPTYWKEVFRVMKPGAHLVAFGGTRTYDLLVLAIRMAGFEIRDQLAWMYGCLSADTECLTRRGWVTHEDLREDDEIMQWDSETGELSWCSHTGVLRFPYDGDLVRLSNRHTDQLLTPNHRVFGRFRRHSRNPRPETYEVVEAGDIKPHWQTDLPMAGMLEQGEEVDPQYAYLVGWWMTDAWAHADGKAVMFSQSKPKTLAKLREALAPYSPSEYVKAAKEPQHADEHTFYVTGSVAERLLSEHPKRRLPWAALGWSRAARGALWQGLMDGDGSRPERQHAEAFWSQDQERRDVFLALSLSLGYRAYEDAENGCVHVNPKTATTQVQNKHRCAPVPYQGTVWCIQVPKTAFVVRRNGRPFITGNTGFPKSLDCPPPDFPPP